MPRRRDEIRRRVAGCTSLEKAASDTVGEGDLRRRVFAVARAPVRARRSGTTALHVELTAGEGRWRNEQTLIVVPDRCWSPDDALGDASRLRLIANLYTIRSDANWGVGDLADLATLAEWGGGVGADFVGVNPLHALLNRGADVSPYSPVSRLFRNPIYIDVMRIPELRDAPGSRSEWRPPNSPPSSTRCANRRRCATSR